MPDDRYQMKFGKYKGKPLMEIPAAYLTWLVAWMLSRNTGRDLRDRIKAHLAGRP